MKQLKISMNKEQMNFLSKHNSFGFRDKSSLVRKAIDHYIKVLESQKLKKSADLYATKRIDEWIAVVFNIKP